MRKLLLLLLVAMPLPGDVIVLPMPAERKISKFRLILTTGEDDLRHNSSVSAFLILKDGRRIESKPLNCNGKQECAPFPANSRRKLEWSLGSKNAITADQIRRFGLSFRSGKAGVRHRRQMGPPRARGRIRRAARDLHAAEPQNPRRRPPFQERRTPGNRSRSSSSGKETPLARHTSM